MTPRATQPFGHYGEQLAIRYLQQKGYQIVVTNWRCTLGEMDIVAKKDQTLVFVEVRSRHEETTETAFESINKRKRSKLAGLAEAYIDLNDLEGVTWRIDVIGIAVTQAGKAIIEHVEDALGW